MYFTLLPDQDRPRWHRLYVNYPSADDDTPGTARDTGRAAYGKRAAAVLLDAARTAAIAAHHLAGVQRPDAAAYYATYTLRTPEAAALYARAILTPAGTPA